MEGFDGTRTLVVGGAGFVGGNLVRELLRHDVKEVRVVDNLLSADAANLPDDSRLRFTHGSITDQQVLDCVDDDNDYIFHLATFHGNQNSIHDPLADHENNTYTTLRLFERIKSFKNLKAVVYSSAGCTVAEKTYDEAESTHEDAPVSLYLDSPYQISKIIGEFYANYYLMRHSLPVIKARFQNVYGPGEILGAGQWRGTPATVWRNVVPTFVYRALKQMPLTVENGGIATRDFIYVQDTVRGLLLCAAAGKPGEVYNLASGVETSILDLANLINRRTENPVAIDYRPKREWDRSGKRFGNTEKARRELGFEARVSLEDGIDETIRWTKSQMSLIDSCIAQHREKMGDCPVTSTPDSTSEERAAEHRAA